MSSTAIMEEGAALHLRPLLEPLGFVFRVVRTANSSGGVSCEAELTRQDRKIELHFRHSLGLVRYHVGSISASHTAYWEIVGGGRARRYPGFGSTPVDAFQHLAADLAHIRSDFVDGDCSMLCEASRVEKGRSAEESRRKMVGFVGDQRAREEARKAFREKDYRKVVSLLDELRYADDMSPAEQKMLSMSKKRLSES